MEMTLRESVISEMFCSRTISKPPFPEWTVEQACRPISIELNTEPTLNHTQLVKHPMQSSRQSLPRLPKSVKVFNFPRMSLLALSTFTKLPMPNEQSRAKRKQRS